MSTFVLVHGAWHGAWCFERFAAELRRRGHGAVAVDLPASDVTAGNVVYADVVAAALPEGDDIVLVGHSLAGLTIPLVAARRPVRSVVYLCALVPEPGRSIVDRLRGGEAIFVPGFSAAVVRDDRGRSFWPEREPAIHDLYHDCPRADAEAAFARLRPQARLPSIETCPLEALPAVATVSVLASGDRAIDPRLVARSRPTSGSAWRRSSCLGGHSPFLAQPAELADMLLGLI